MPVFAILQAGKSRFGGQPIWYGDPDNPQPFTISNLAANGNIWIGPNQSVGPTNPNESTPVGPGGFLSFDGSLPVYYVIADQANVQAVIYPGVISVFQPSTVSFTNPPAGGNPAEDGSTPAVIHVGQVIAPSGTTASFTPPANTLLVAIVNVNSNTTGGSPNITVSDSGGHTWTKRISIADAQFLDNSSIWTAPITTSAAITVTAGNSDATVNSSLQLAVRVINNANANQSGAATASVSQTSTNFTGNIVTTKVGSLVYVASTSILASGAVANSGTTTIDDYEGGAGSALAGKSTANTTLAGSTSFGWSTGNSELYSWVALEVIP